MRILSPAFVRRFKGRILNIHPSLLPAYKGAHAVRDAWADGAKVTGVTVHLVTEALDSGPVILQAALPVGEKDTEKILEAGIHRLEHKLYPKAVRLLAEGRLKLDGRRVRIQKKKRR
jgi:Folate-dependent phosphoribosylglycinamide formyltransferase PurN